MCCVQKYTAIVNISSCKRLVVVVEMHCVVCEVGTEIEVSRCSVCRVQQQSVTIRAQTRDGRCPVVWSVGQAGAVSIWW